MHPDVLEERIEAAKRIVDGRERELKAAHSYLDQARSTLTELEGEKEHARLRALEATVKA